MKKLILVAVALLCVTAFTVQAGDKKGKAPKKELTPEQKQLMDKYDANKDGKLDEGEKAAMTAEDKAAWAKAAGSHGKKKGKE
jgi:hypothetical protein